MVRGMGTMALHVIKQIEDIKIGYRYFNVFLLELAIPFLRTLVVEQDK